MTCMGFFELLRRMREELSYNTMMSVLVHSLAYPGKRLTMAYDAN